MLAQNFKTPADLSITDAEFDALHKVLGMLEREELQHARMPRSLDGNFAGQKFSGWFNMRCFVGEAPGCGTVTCIAGTCDLMFGTNFTTRYWSRGLPKDLRKTFGEVIDVAAFDCNSITPQQAAIALRNYLTHGEPRWAEALAT